MPNITQRIAMEGAEQIKSALAQIAAAGKTAFDSLSSSAAKTIPVISAVQASATGLAATLAGTQTSVTASFGAISTAAVNTSKTIVASVQGTVSPITALGANLRGLVSNFTISEHAAHRFGATLFGLGRALHMPELGHFGHSIGILGKAFALAAPLILVIGLQRLVKGAAEAAKAVEELAQKLGVAEEEVGKLGNLATAVGDSFKIMGGNATALKKLLEETAQSEKEIADALGIASHAADNEVDAQGYLVSAYARSTVAKKELNALQKLGITGAIVDKDGKASVTIEIYKRIADALHNLDATQRENIENDLLEAGVITKNLIPALEGGAEAIEKYEAEGQRIKPKFTDEQTAALKKYEIAQQQVIDSLAALRNALGAAVAPAFVAFFDQLRELFIQLRPGLEGFGSTLGAVLKPALEGVIAVIRLVAAAFSSIIGIIAAGFRLLTGASSSWINAANIFAGLLLVLLLYLGGMPLAIVALIAAFDALWHSVEEPAKNLVESFKKLWDAALGYVSNFIESSINYFQGWYDSIVKWINDLIDRFKSFLGLSSGAPSGAASSDSGGPALASGGHVRGRGTGTSDSILARLSNGEFVMRSAAVSHYGTSFMSAINNMSAFAAGGLVALPRFASGGGVRSGAGGGALHPVHLHIGNETVSGLLAPAHVADRLAQIATSNRIRRAGRKPSWVGG